MRYLYILSIFFPFFAVSASVEYDFSLDGEKIQINKYENGTIKKAYLTDSIAKKIINSSPSALREFSFKFGINTQKFLRTLDGVGKQLTTNDIELFNTASSAGDQLEEANLIVSPVEYCLPRRSTTKDSRIIIETNVSQLTVAPGEMESFIARAFNSYYQPIIIDWAYESPYPQYATFDLTGTTKSMDFFILFNGIEATAKGPYTDLAGTYAGPSGHKSHSRIFNIQGHHPGNISVKVGKSAQQSYSFGFANSESGSGRSVDPSASQDIQIEVSESALKTDDDKIVKYVIVSDSTEEAGILYNNTPTTFTVKFLNRKLKQIPEIGLCKKGKWKWEPAHFEESPNNEQLIHNCSITLTPDISYNKSFYGVGDDVIFDEDEERDGYYNSFISYTVPDSGPFQPEVIGGANIGIRNREETKLNIKIAGPALVSADSHVVFYAKLHLFSYRAAKPKCEIKWNFPTDKFDALSESEDRISLKVKDSPEWREYDPNGKINGTYVKVDATCDGIKYFASSRSIFFTEK